MAANEEIVGNELTGKKVTESNMSQKVTSIRQCFRMGGRVFRYRCPAYTRMVGEVSRIQKCCRITNPILLRYLRVIWGVALAEPTIFGEVVAVVSTVVVGGIILHQYAEEHQFCIDYYADRCSGFKCADCLKRCLIVGRWDHNKCPLKP